MNANPFLIDFFSLARGYGIAIGLMVSGFYFYCRYIEDQKNKYHFFALLFLCFAALANFALINVVLVFILVHNSFQFFILKRKFSIKNIWQVNYSTLILLSLLTAICYEPIRKITQLKMFDFGGTNGFWEDTVASLLYSLSYYSPYEYNFVIICKVLVIIFSALFVTKCVLYLISRKLISLTQKIMLFFGLNLFLVMLSSIFQNGLFKTPFLANRFALFLYPLFILTSCFLIMEVLKSSYKYVIHGLLSLMVLMFFGHTCYSVNTSWYYEWKYDMNTKDMLEKLDTLRKNKNISLGITWVFEPSINFYKKTHKLEWINEVNREGLKPENDYFYVRAEDFQKTLKEEVTIICYYIPTDNYLVKHIKCKVSIPLR
jgi:hypothetical protein